MDSGGQMLRGRSFVKELDVTPEEFQFLLTMAEHAERPLTDIAYAYLGDARNNMGNSLLVAGALLGMDVRIVAPPGLLPPVPVQAAARELAQRSGARITLTDDVAEGVRGV